MRGAERPAKIQWTRQFLPPLEPLSQDASQKTFIDIADSNHMPAEIDRILALAGNMPLAISLLANWWIQKTFREIDFGSVGKACSFDDTDIKCKFYIGIAHYYVECRLDLPMAREFCQTAISLAMLTGNARRHIIAFYSLALNKERLGDYAAAQLHASQAQQLARVYGNLLSEAVSLHIAAMCWYTLGNYRQSIFLSNQALHLLSLCGISGGSLKHALLNSQAEVHKFKSEYVEALNIQTQIICETLLAHIPIHLLWMWWDA
ncbi:hypothetical protein B0H19DRAFT_1083006 [Mycena capillaripes]|nr:hypothetical protein B0H19DRAFT_1083006 [Mycena capillaripes]